MSLSRKPKVLVITGPTNVGKSSLALSIAKTHHGEIITADSVQVYRGLDIGSNKASEEERDEVVHHLLDIVGADDGFSAGEFLDYVKKAIGDVCRKGCLPVVVGGTMMYLRWLVRGRPEVPKVVDGDVKERVGRMLGECGGVWEKGVGLLRVRDEKRAGEILVNDWYRLRRALEVVESEGVGIGMMPRVGASTGDGVERRRNEWDLRLVFLWRDKWDLYRGIDLRCEQMLIGSKGWGLIEEVGKLLETHQIRLERDGPGRAIGYRQTIEYLANRANVALCSTKRNEEMNGAREEEVNAFRDFVHTFMGATRRYAKQQISWFRKDPDFFWVRAGNTETVNRIVKMSEYEYASFVEKEQQDQQEMRKSIIEQGRQMKLFISEKSLLKDNSDCERELVERAEAVAQRLASELGQSGLDVLTEKVRLLSCV